MSECEFVCEIQLLPTDYSSEVSELCTALREKGCRTSCVIVGTTHNHSKVKELYVNAWLMSQLG